MGEKLPDIDLGTKDYDYALMDVPFFQIHPEYLPFIGKDYASQNHKVLIIGESHYVAKDWDWDETSYSPWWQADWYEQLLEEKNDWSSWFNTRTHANRATVLSPNKEAAISQVIQNPIKELVSNGLYKAEYSDALLSNIAFMNFFQFPSLINGIDIWTSFVKRIKGSRQKITQRYEIWDDLVTKSTEVVNRVIDIIEPDLVIICSLLAGKEYAKKNNSCTQQYIEYTAHSTNRPWYSPQKHFAGISGQRRCDQIIKLYLANKNN